MKNRQLGRQRQRRQTDERVPANGTRSRNRHGGKGKAQFTTTNETHTKRRRQRRLVVALARPITQLAEKIDAQTKALASVSNAVSELAKGIENCSSTKFSSPEEIGAVAIEAEAIVLSEEAKAVDICCELKFDSGMLEQLWLDKENFSAKRLRRQMQQRMQLAQKLRANPTNIDKATREALGTMYEHAGKIEQSLENRFSVRLGRLFRWGWRKLRGLVIDQLGISDVIKGLWRGRPALLNG